MAGEITRKQVNHTRYDDMEFPDYQFQEFPQAVPVVGGKVMPTPYDERNKAHPVVIVNSQEELDALQGPQVTLVPVSEAAPEGAQRVENEADIRAALKVQAEQVGAKIDGRWPVDRQEAAIRDHVEAKAAKNEIV